jgi:hypothetical protein
MDFLGQITCTAGQTLVGFEQIPQTYKDLQLWVYKFNNESDSAGSDRLTMNGSTTGSDYTISYTQAYGATRLTSRFSNTGNIGDGYGSMGSGTRQPFTHIIDIYDYASSTKLKQVIGFFGFHANAGEYSPEAGMYSSAYLQQTAVTSLTYAASSTTGWSSASTFTLYGIGGTSA